MKLTVLSVAMAALYCAGLTRPSLAAPVEIRGTTVKQTPSAVKRRPNIILLVADDLGWGDLSSYGHPSVRTPNLDRMAAEGQRWTNFYVSAPTCSPSRGAMLTGRTETRTGLYGVRNGVAIENDPYGFPDRETTIATVLKRAGYNTALFGKWHLGDAPRAYPTRHGFDYWWGTPLSNDAFFIGGTTNEALRKLMAAGTTREQILQLYVTQARAAFTNPKAEWWNLPLIKSQVGGQSMSQAGSQFEGQFRDELLERPINQETYEARLTDEVLNYLRAPRKAPFFIMVGFEKPHLPHVPGKAFAGKSAAGPFGDVMAELDHNIGKILDALKQSGQAKNTLVVFVSDNGPWYLFEEFGGSAGMLRDAKFSTYEGGVRVPAIFWQPGVIKPALISDIASSYEFMPTFAAMAGAPLPNTVLDGYNLSNTLNHGAPSPRSTMPYYSNGRLMAWRDGDWKLNIIEANGRTYASKKLDKPTLYHLGRDPGEKFDLANAEPAVAERLLQAAHTFEASFAKVEPEFDRMLKPVAATPSASK